MSGGVLQLDAGAPWGSARIRMSAAAGSMIGKRSMAAHSADAASTPGCRSNMSTIRIDAVRV